MAILQSGNKEDRDLKFWLNPQFTRGLATIIVPIYNRAAIIEETLNSAWLQTYRPIELIIINDGSTDHTEEVVIRWIGSHQNDPEFTATYYYQNNAGVCAARNHALRKSTGEFIQFLDSDDLIHPVRMEKVIKLFNETNCEYVETGFEVFFKVRGDLKQNHFGHTVSDHVDLLLLGRLWPNTLRLTYRRNLIVKTGPWNESMKTFTDYEYAIRALVRRSKTRYQSIGEILASARRDHGQRISDIHKTQEGRAFRIHCESVLCDRVKRCDYIKNDIKQVFISRLYSLGIRSNANGWIEHGRQCFEIADSLPVKINSWCKFKRLVCRMGRAGGMIYKYSLFFKELARKQAA